MTRAKQSAMVDEVLHAALVVAVTGSGVVQHVAVSSSRLAAVARLEHLDELGGGARVALGDDVVHLVVHEGKMRGFGGVLPRSAPFGGRFAAFCGALGTFCCLLQRFGVLLLSPTTMWCSFSRE